MVTQKGVCQSCRNAGGKAPNDFLEEMTAGVLCLNTLWKPFLPSPPMPTTPVEAGPIVHNQLARAAIFLDVSMQ